MTINDLTRTGDHFPLSRPLPDGDSDAPALRPFGLRFASTPTAAAMVDLDWSRIGYDETQQVATVTDDDGTVLPAMRHTSTRTSTTTASQDRNPTDNDTDTTGT
jgi:putative ATP-grasp target RiPP